MERVYPKHCADCGGVVTLVTKTGRVVAGFLLPEDIHIPTCDQCEEEYWDESLTDEVDKFIAGSAGAV